MSIAVIAVISVGVILMTIMPLFLTRYHLNRLLMIEYGYDNAELSLLTLMSDRKIYKGISLYAAGLPDDASIRFSRSDVESAVKARLGELVPSGCFNLSFSSGTIKEIISDRLSSKQCSIKYSASAYIALPSGSDGGENREKITLGIDDTPATQMEIPPKKYCCYGLYTPETKCETVDNCVGDWRIDRTQTCSDPSFDCSKI